MKHIKTPSSILQVARLYRPSVDGVKREVLNLVKASPTFSYQDLQQMIFDLLRGFASYEQVEKSIQSIGYDLKRNSYARAIDPAWHYLKTLQRNYTLSIDPRSYAISREIRVPCIPPMVCGTPDGQIIPWLMLWKTNVLREEQMALFVSMALEVMEQDSELEDARLLVIDTSDASVGQDGMPKVIDCSGLGRLGHEQLSKMLNTFVHGFKLAVAEWEQGSRIVKESGLRAGLDSNQAIFQFNPEDN